MDVILFSIIGAPNMLARTIEEDEEAVYVEYPFSLYREGHNVIANPYMPLAKDGVVIFKKSQLISTSIAPLHIVKHYESLVEELKDIKFTLKKPPDINENVLPFENKLVKKLH